MITRKPWPNPDAACCGDADRPPPEQRPPSGDRIYLALCPSRRLIGLGLLLHGLALSGIVVLLVARWSLAVTLADQVMLGLSCIGLGLLVWQSARQSLRQARLPVRMLCLEPDGQLAVLWADAADFHPVDLQWPAVMLPWLVLLQGVDNTTDAGLGPPRPFSLPVLCDSLADDLPAVPGAIPVSTPNTPAARREWQRARLRQLRVWLRWRALPAAVRTHPE